MPFSSHSGKQYIDRTINRLTGHLGDVFFKHKKILDLGAGSGTYFDRYSQVLPKDKFQWIAVEIWEPYIKKYNLESKYSCVIKDDAVDTLAWMRAGQTGKMCDICFIGDLAEHMTKEKAIEMVKLAVSLSDLVIISIPIVHYPQDEYEGNPYEKHVKDDWSHEEVMSSFDHIFEWGVEGEIGVYLLSDEKAGLLQQALKPMVGVYGICKNESEFIKRCYESVKDADFIVFCDTGSTDETMDTLVKLVHERSEEHGIEEELTTREVDGKIVEVDLNRSMTVLQICVSPWRFDDARNTALMVMSPDVDLCISIDADEMLQPGWRSLIDEAILNELRTTGRVVTRYHHRFSTIWNWNSPEQQESKSEHWHERIHPRKGYLWKLPVHEVLVSVDQEKIGWIPDLMMIQKPDLQKSRSSYLDLLKISLKEDPHRWKSWFFYAGEVFNDLSEAKLALEKALVCPDADSAYLQARISDLYRQHNMIDQAINHMQLAIMTAPHIREYRVYMAKLLRSAGLLDQAKIMIMSADRIAQPTTGYVYNPECWDSRFEELREELCRQ